MAPKFLHFGTAMSRSTSGALSPLLFSRRFPPKLLRFVNCSTSAALDCGSSGGADDAPQQLSGLTPHPWPEWVSFVDGLKAKGFLAKSSPDGDGAGGDGAAATESVYCDMNALKDACLSYGRARRHGLRSLSSVDIQTVVGIGCPNILRKVVNSAKRLRAHLQVDEGDVCGSCKLRDTCDRAYVILKGSEATARTVDITRILLTYALDPLVLSGGDKPLGREVVEASVRKLISELSELSEKPLAVETEKANTEPSTRSKVTNFALSKDVEMKRGDWICRKCNFMNFSKNKKCLRCNENAPVRPQPDEIEKRDGDWTCPECNFMNFARNPRCLKCDGAGPKKIINDGIEMKRGDWICPQCSFMNFANKKNCFQCRRVRPKNKLGPQDWECPKCDFVNFRGNRSCRKCNGTRPNRSVEYEERQWDSHRNRGGS